MFSQLSQSDFAVRPLERENHYLLEKNPIKQDIYLLLTGKRWEEMSWIWLLARDRYSILGGKCVQFIFKKGLPVCYSLYAWSGLYLVCSIPGLVYEGVVYTWSGLWRCGLYLVWSMKVWSVKVTSSLWLRSSSYSRASPDISWGLK